MTAELKDLRSAEAAANWAHRALALKDTLTSDDAEQVRHSWRSSLSRASAVRWRQKARAGISGASSASRSGAHQLSGHAAVPGLRPTIDRPPPLSSMKGPPPFSSMNSPPLRLFGFCGIFRDIMMLRNQGRPNLAFINPAVPPMALWGYRR
jgi:hypothetical protein